MLVVGRIDDDWPTSAEVYDKYQQKSYRIDMFKWVWRQSTLQFGRRITEFGACSCMSVLMETDRDDKCYRQTNKFKGGE